MGRVRIIGGRWRRRLLPVADVPGLRPTPDRVRETLFNWLGQDLTGWSCLDLFAGSGALGFEAASRGAARVTLVERDAGVCKVLRQNAAALEYPGLQVVQGDALQFVASAAARYDLVFLDPPYRSGWIERLAPRLSGVLTERGLIYVEAEHPVDGLCSRRCIRNGRAGQVHFHLLAPDETACAAAPDSEGTT